MLVSVYIPTKNRLALLKRAINSVKQQNYPLIELIVFDDCSSDGTREFLAAEQSRGQLIAILSSTSSGACQARNIAIQHCKGTYVTGLDDDDYFARTDKISRFVTVWNSLNERISGLFDSVLLQGPEGESVRCQAPYASHQDLLKSNAIGGYVFAPKTHFIESGLFDPDMPAWQDWDLWIRMSKHYGPFKNILLGGTVIDETHGHARISTKPQATIRQAMLNLTRKLSPLTLKERSYLISSLHAYPQIKPSLGEVMTLVAALRLKASICAMKKLLISPPAQ